MHIGRLLPTYLTLRRKWVLHPQPANEAVMDVPRGDLLSMSLSNVYSRLDADVKFDVCNDGVTARTEGELKVVGSLEDNENIRIASDRHVGSV